MEGSGEAFSIDASAPTAGVRGPFVETHAAAVSLDRDLRQIPQVGPAEKRIAREMGQRPTKVQDQQADPVVQTNKTVGERLIGPGAAVAPAPINTFKGLDLQN